MVAIYLFKNVDIECDQKVIKCELSTTKAATNASKLIDG